MKKQMTDAKIERVSLQKAPEIQYKVTVFWGQSHSTYIYTRTLGEAHLFIERNKEVYEPSYDEITCNNHYTAD